MRGLGSQLLQAVASLIRVGVGVGVRVRVRVSPAAPISGLWWVLAPPTSFFLAALFSRAEGTFIAGVGFSF